ncbi:MAG: hypothetical protein PHP55_04980 [Methanoculleus sp.]|nr:hypothetical protein [Methanoculleus sp.]
MIASLYRRGLRAHLLSSNSASCGQCVPPGSYTSERRHSNLRCLSDGWKTRRYTKLSGFLELRALAPDGANAQPFSQERYTDRSKVPSMGSEEADTVAQEIMAALDDLFRKERRARLQVSALEERQYALAATFRMVQDMEADSAIEEALAGYGFEYYTVDDDAELWISDEHGLMVFLSFTAPGGQYYNYRIVAFDIIGEEEEESG